MLVWCSRAADRASAWNRFRWVASVRKVGCMTFERHPDLERLALGLIHDAHAAAAQLAEDAVIAQPFEVGPGMGGRTGRGQPRGRVEPLRGCLARHVIPLARPPAKAAGSLVETSSRSRSRCVGVEAPPPGIARGRHPGYQEIARQDEFRREIRTSRSDRRLSTVPGVSPRHARPSPLMAIRGSCDGRPDAVDREMTVTGSEALPQPSERGRSHDGGNSKE